MEQPIYYESPFRLETSLNTFEKMQPSLARALLEDSVPIPDTDQHWKETDEDYVFTATLPAFDKGIDDEYCERHYDPKTRILQVTGKQTIEEAKDQIIYNMVQGYELYFYLIVKLPENVDAHAVKMKTVQSVLTLNLPKIRKTSPGPAPDASMSSGHADARADVLKGALILRDIMLTKPSM